MLVVLELSNTGLVISSTAVGDNAIICNPNNTHFTLDLDLCDNMDLKDLCTRQISDILLERQVRTLNNNLKGL